MSPSSAATVEAQKSGETPTVPPPFARRDHLAGHEIHQPHEIGDHAVGGLGIDFVRRAVLLQPPAAHHRDVVGQRERLGLVVGDVDEGDAGAALQLLELGAHALAQLGVEVGQRLVEQ